MTALNKLPLLEDGDDEPLPGCVVLDRDGDAWQHVAGYGWVRAGVRGEWFWGDLVVEFGPLRLLFEPDDEPVEPR